MAGTIQCKKKLGDRDSVEGNYQQEHGSKLSLGSLELVSLLYFSVCLCVCVCQLNSQNVCVTRLRRKGELFCTDLKWKKKEKQQDLHLSFFFMFSGFFQFSLSPFF